MSNGAKSEAVGGVAGGLLTVLGQALGDNGGDVLIVGLLLVALLVCVAVRWDLAKRNLGADNG